MSQDDPRGALSTFGDFGLYCNGTDTTLRVEMQKLDAYYEGAGGYFRCSLDERDEWNGNPGTLSQHVPGWGPAVPAYTDTEPIFGWGDGSAGGGTDGWQGEDVPCFVRGTLRTGSLARTYDGYQAIPAGFNCLHSFFGPMAKLFFGPQWGEYVTRFNTPYYALSGTRNLPVDYVWACPPSEGLPARSLPYYYTDDSAISFNSVYDGTSLSSSFATLVGKLYQASGACLAILSGGTLANYGSNDTSFRVHSAVSEATAAAEEGESLCVAERLSRIESAISQLIALTTYSYYVSGASVDSAPASGASVAEGVLNYLKQFLGSGMSDSGSPLVEEGEEE